ncbi:Protein CBG18741 [Caenorhabditis briggsae]|uniref:Uncharacterized protein n=2 Tax=Caenorhabditis briggsae TaxID=6238 RepID=A0AAE9D4H6_CAEBR|nr:Protein CBG18741 [Caenorhabditis briggsae]ULT93584.1 hypothetical protein L3Y34_003227 [Caenorhabditis briggsae]CAP36137.2 Protein CBG18741 [Caenorhabditis briggsae]
MNASSSCSDMEAIATYLPLRILLFSFITIAVVTIPMIIYVIKRIIRNPLYHKNTKVVLVAHAIALIVHFADRLIFHGWDLHRYIIILPDVLSPCDIISSSERCFFLRISFNSAMWFCVCTTPALTLERYLATRRTFSYQSDKHSWSLVLGFQFLLTAFLLALIYSKQSFGGQALYCMTASSSLPLHVLAVFVITIIIQLVSIGWYRHLVKRNEKLRELLQKTGGDLIRKYQVEETLRAFRILHQPIHLMFIFHFLYSSVSFFVLYFNPYFSRPLYFFLMEANIYLPEYSLAFVITFIRMENRVSDNSSQGLRKSIEIDTAVYFENYQKDWN